MAAANKCLVANPVEKDSCLLNLCVWSLCCLAKWKAILIRSASGKETGGFISFIDNIICVVYRKDAVCSCKHLKQFQSVSSKVKALLNRWMRVQTTVTRHKCPPLSDVAVWLAFIFILCSRAWLLFGLLRNRQRLSRRLTQTAIGLQQTIILIID